MEEMDPDITELPPERTAHIRNHFPKPFSEAPFRIDLPYALLGGEGFERLCALLLIADGQTPRYFGKRGTADYGVDVIVSDGAGCVVYQCKNVATYKRGDLSRWLNTFAQAWLIERPHLPKPQKYVLLCPLDLRNKDDVEIAQSNFSRDYDVLVEIWQKTMLDERLKRLPDTVSDLFSATIADFFCSLGRHWDDGFTAPLAPSGRGARAIDRFLKLQEEARFAHDENVLEERLDLIEDEGLVAFIGPSGAGKTMAALELASAMAEHGWRPWHVDMRNVDPARLYESIERRAVRPSVFVLDDCHLAPDQTHGLMTRIRTAGLNKRARLILTVTTTAISGDVAVDDGAVSRFVDEDIEPQQQINVHPKRDMYRRIVATARPDLGEISTKTTEHLIATTAGNLFLLDEALRATTDTETGTPVTLDSITFETLQKETMERYFGERFPSAPAIRRIAAVAQFDVSVPKAMIEEPPSILRNRMLVSTGPPPAWLFTHAALAELIYCALSNGETESDRNHFAIDAIIGHVLLGTFADHWVDRLTQILRTRLKLVDDLPLKQRLLRDERLLRALHVPDLSIPLSTVALACFLSYDGIDPSPYRELLFGRIKDCLTGAIKISGDDTRVLGSALRTLRLVDAERFATIFEISNAELCVLNLGAHVDLLATMSIFGCVTPDFADRLIEALDRDTLDTLVKKTIDGARSVRTISLALRELGERDKDQRQLAAFEARLGVDRMMLLIAKRTDLSAMMKILENVTPEFAVQLIAELDPDVLDALVKRTIEEGRSVATIGLALRELGDRDKDQRQLAAFETRFGTGRMISLIRERADLPTMMKILENVTPGFATQLIEALNSDILDALVKKTIDEGRSVRTIGFALRELGDRDKDQRQLAAFEARLGTDRMISLIRERADLRAAGGIFDNVTPGFATQLMEALDFGTIDALINNTISSKALNIRNLPFNRRLFAYLQNKMDGETWWRLILGCGDLGALSSILVALGPKAGVALLAVLKDSKQEDWATILERTNSYGFSIFCVNAMPALSPTAHTTFEDASVVNMSSVIARSTWSELAIGHTAVLGLQCESRAKAAFLEQFAVKIAAVDLISPPTFDDLATAANFIQILWQQRTKDRATLAGSVFHILPKHNEWPLDQQRLTGARLLLALSQSEEMPQQTAEKIFGACATLPQQFKITSCDAMSLFLFLFNVWAVLIARAPADVKNLVASQDEKLWTGLLERIDAFANTHDDEQKLNLLALVGLLEFTGVFSKEKLDGRVRGVVRGFPILLKAADKHRAVTRFFAFRGLDLIGPRHVVNSRERIDRLLSDLSEYEIQTPALHLIREHLSSRR